MANGAKQPNNNGNVGGTSLSSQNVARIEMVATKYRAASQVADGTMLDAEIAKQAGVSRRQLDRWKKEPAFAALVNGITGKAANAIRDEAVASKAGRLRILTDLHNKLLQIIEARMQAADRIAAMQGEGGSKLQTPRSVWAAGEDTGLIVTKETWGKANSHEASVDTSLIKQILDLQERIAKELGQWDYGRVDIKHSGSVDHVVHVPERIRNLTTDQLLALEEIAASAIAAEHEVTA